MPRFTRILCPVDFDANSRTALGVAAEMAHEGDATLYILHVAAMPPGPEVALSFSKVEALARARLERLARQKVDGRARYQVEVVMGNPDVEILQTARRRRANLIVMATHGRRGLRRLVLGSVAESVVREAPCPVLTVKPKAATTSGPAPRRRTKSKARA